MVNRWVIYDESVKEQSRSLYDSLKSSGYDVDIRLGDVYGPERSAISVQINVKKRYILADYNSGFWRIAFFKADDVEGANGINFSTNLSDTTKFLRLILEFLDAIV